MRLIEKIKVPVLKFPFLSPLLFIVFFVLSGYHEMQDYAGPLSVFIPFFVLAGIVLGIFYLFNKISGSGLKAALISNVIVLPVIFFGPVYELIGKIYFIELMFRYKVILVLFFFVTGIIAALIVRSKRTFARSNTLLCVYGALLVTMEAGKITVRSFSRAELDSYTHRNEPIQLPSNLPARLPNVYYLVFDMHTGYESLSQYFNYPDSTFIRYLESKGFCVVKNASSNYNVTLFSMASSLNMQHLDKVPEFRDEDMARECILGDLIRNNRTAKIFNSMGYELINLSLFDMDDSKRFYSRYYPFSLYKHLIEKTALSKKHLEIILNTTITHERFLGVFPSGNMYTDESTRALFSELIKLPGQLNKQTKPSFIYAHFLVAHWPYVFDKNGGRRSVLNDKYEDLEKYLDQLIYTDKLITQMVDTILSNSQIPPVIIIQGDHGFNKFAEKDRFKASVNILNAYYFPDGCKGKIYDTITPVNSFAVLFNSVFNFQFKLQEDKSMVVVGNAEHKKLNHIECNGLK